MQYFAVVFFVFSSVLCAYMYSLIDAKDSLILENASLQSALEVQSRELSEEKLKYFETLQKNKDATVNRIQLDKSTCESELASYKALIRAM